MVGERIAIDAAVLNGHAGKVDRVADDVRVAVQAARQTMLSSGAFGLMCSWMVPPFLITTTTATETMVSAAAALERSARELRAVATDFDEVEQQVGQKLNGLRSGLDAI